MLYGIGFKAQPLPQWGVEVLTPRGPEIIEKGLVVYEILLLMI